MTCVKLSTVSDGYLIPVNFTEFVFRILGGVIVGKISHGNSLFEQFCRNSFSKLNLPYCCVHLKGVEPSTPKF